MNKDCIFYTEIQDMHATISQCRRSTKFADCPCGNDCEHYIPIELARSMDIKPAVRAEWKWNNDNRYYYCSECGAVSPQEDQDGEYINCPHFCPNCGADMREHNNE